MLTVSFMTIMASSCIGTAEHSPTVELGESKILFISAMSWILLA